MALELENLVLFDDATPSPVLPTNESYLDVILSPDLRGELVKYFSWSVLRIMVAINQEMRAWAYDIMRARIRLFLGLFLPVEYLHDFFELLHDSGSAVAGGLIRCIMSPLSDYYYDVNPNSVDIVVPSNHSANIPATRRWHNFLLRSEYVLLSRCRFTSRFEDSCSSFTKYEHVRVFVLK